MIIAMLLKSLALLLGVSLVGKIVPAIHAFIISPPDLLKEERLPRTEKPFPALVTDTGAGSGMQRRQDSTLPVDKGGIEVTKTGFLAIFSIRYFLCGTKDEEATDEHILDGSTSAGSSILKVLSDWSTNNVRELTAKTTGINASSKTSEPIAPATTRHQQEVAGTESAPALTRLVRFIIRCLLRCTSQCVGFWTSIAKLTCCTLGSAAPTDCHLASQSNKRSKGKGNGASKKQKKERDYDGDDFRGEKNGKGNGDGSKPNGEEEKPAGPYLACPYYKLDPHRHFRCLSKYELTKFTYVKQHVLRCHVLAPYYCPTCWEQWSDNDEAGYEAHALRKNCSTVPGPEHLRRLEQQSFKNEQIPPGLNDEQKWYLMWDTLFSLHPPPPSPYVKPLFFEVMEQLLLGSTPALVATLPAIYGQYHDWTGHANAIMETIADAQHTVPRRYRLHPKRNADTDVPSNGAQWIDHGQVSASAGPILFDDQNLYNNPQPGPNIMPGSASPGHTLQQAGTSHVQPGGPIVMPTPHMDLGAGPADVNYWHPDNWPDGNFGASQLGDFHAEGLENIASPTELLPSYNDSPGNVPEESNASWGGTEPQGAGGALATSTGASASISEPAASRGVQPPPVA